MENNSSLFQKLMQKLHLDTIRGKSIVKNVKNGLCAALLSTALLFNTGCQPINNNNNNNNNNNENSSQTGNNNNNNENNENKDPYANYSEVLQNVLKSEYYNNLVVDAKWQELDKDYSFRTANKYQAIPYGFLEDEGFDIDAIKNDKLKCETDVFLIDKDLYIACRVENKAEINYYTHFVVKYQLTDKEIADLNLTHKEYPDGTNLARTVSFQAPFFIQELSLVKEAIKLSEANITKDAELGVEKNMTTKVKENPNIDMSNFGNNIGITYLGNWIEEGKMVSSSYLFFNNTTNLSPSIENKKISKITFTGYWSGDVSQIENENHIRTGASGTHVLESYYNDVNNNLTTVKFYNSYYSDLIDMLTPKYMEFYGLEQ